jgi:hypothetical protein
MEAVEAEAGSTVAAVAATDRRLVLVERLIVGAWFKSCGRLPALGSPIGLLAAIDSGANQMYAVVFGSPDFGNILRSMIRNHRMGCGGFGGARCAVAEPIHGDESNKHCEKQND